MSQPFHETMRLAGVKFSDVTARDFTRGVDYVIDHTLAANTATRFLINELATAIKPLFADGRNDDNARWAKFRDMSSSTLEISGQAMLAVSKEASIIAHITKTSQEMTATSIVPVSALLKTARDASLDTSAAVKLLKESTAGAARAPARLDATGKATATPDARPQPTTTKPIVVQINVKLYI